MRHISFIFLLIIVTITSTNAAKRLAHLEQIYDLKDLRVLKNDKSFEEFFIHAKDIRPGKRTQEWNAMVVTMAMDMLQSYIDNKSISESQFNTLLNISKWSAIKNNEFFTRKRDQIALMHFKKCFSSYSWSDCYKKINKYYTDQTQIPETGVALTSLLIANNKIIKDSKDEDYTIVSIDFWPLIKPMAQSSISEFYCNKNPMKKIIINKMYKQAKSKYNSIIHNDCLKAITPGLIEELLTTTNPYIRYKTFTVLQKANKINKEQTYLYYTLQFLDGHNQDKIQTLKIFEALKSISQDYKLRENIVMKLKKMTPLPGKLFSFNHNSQRIMAKAISKNIPEYIDFYSTTCIEHLSGRKVTPGGNPATYCHDLFNMADIVSLIPDSKLSAYKKLMNSWKI